MGVTKGGRFAAVTNFRDPSDKRSTALSRGTLVADFLLADATAEAFLAASPRARALFNGFNLIVGDGERLMYFGSREPAPRASSPACTAFPTTCWTSPGRRSSRARTAMQAALADAEPAPRLFDLLSDTRGAEDSELPDTGVGSPGSGAWPRRSSPAPTTARAPRRS